MVTCRRCQPEISSYPVTVTDIILSGLMIRKGIISRMSSHDRKKAGMVIEELGLIRNWPCQQ